MSKYQNGAGDFPRPLFDFCVSDDRSL